MYFPNALEQACGHLIKNGLSPYVVGGAVRDWLLKLTPKDFDIEVHGVSSEEEFEKIISQLGQVDLVGKSYGIYKVKLTDGETYDFSLPRIEVKTGNGHKEFEVTVISGDNILKQAAARRDFTINAIYWDVDLGGYEDPYGGIFDLQAGIIRHTSEAFSEDPLRVLRAFQFASRFNFTVAPETVELCKNIIGEFHTISKERIWVEFQKWAEKSIAPENGIQFLIDCGWIRCFPLLNQMIGIKQSPIHHPEGSLENHIIECLKAIRRVDPTLEGERKVLLSLAVLTHDLGKITHTQFHECGKITAYGHEGASGPLAREFLHSIDCPHHIIDQVVPLCENHMMQNNNINDAILRRAAVRIHPANLLDLCFLMECDKRGRPPHPDIRPEKIQLALDLITKLGVGIEKPKPILLGRHLIENGIKPGKEMGNILKIAYEAQLDGGFTTVEGGLIYINAYFDAVADTL